jgi:hypothetical protein
LLRLSARLYSAPAQIKRKSTWTQNCALYCAQHTTPEGRAVFSEIFDTQLANVFRSFSDLWHAAQAGPQVSLREFGISSDEIIVCVLPYPRDTGRLLDYSVLTSLHGRSSGERRSLVV